MNRDVNKEIEKGMEIDIKSDSIPQIIDGEVEVKKGIEYVVITRKRYEELYDEVNSLKKLATEERKRTLEEVAELVKENINGIIKTSGNDSHTQWFDGLRCARETLVSELSKLKYKDNGKE